MNAFSQKFCKRKTSSAFECSLKRTFYWGHFLLLSYSTFNKFILHIWMSLIWSCFVCINECKFFFLSTVAKRHEVDFINILHAHFLYESALRSFLELCSSFVHFWRKNIGAKCVRKMLMKLTPNVIIMWKKTTSHWASKCIRNLSKSMQVFHSLAKWNVSTNLH